ncbi:tRNA-splicing endonuclease subunit Sen2 isoform X3 [Syngnathus acus]|uniref:tRNA-splicing endonuclease subunit Sen2 isoform X3 n=1 Tax=Syngnathus acus TaxID=161584 RepID=UPI0018860326|nr:tRNA-splicing endonuclease subunit Sen2 isoform X3 [Syngnathus acus]
MFQADFRPPRGRCRVDEDYVAPLPVSRSSSQTTGVTSPTTTSRFRADLVNRHVLVTEPEHIRDLHNQGYFGKGVLSRARPEHGVSDRWQQHEGFLLPVVTQARYEELLGRAESSLLAQGLAQVVVNQTLLWLRQPIRADVLRREAEDGEAARSDTLANLRSEPGGSMLRELGPASSPDLRPDRGANSEPDDAPLVPGPGFVIIDAGHVAAQLRRNPLRMTEFLELGLEEAPLSITELWRHLVALRPDFVSSYAAYHHFRSRGWVPKGGSGAKYGVDMLLYRKGPSFYHASYSVMVEKVDERFQGSALRAFSWRSLATLSRITANVSKELLLCYVIHPADLSEAELDSPACLSKLKVQNIMVSRWVSSKERAEQEDV